MPVNFADRETLYLIYQLETLVCLVVSAVLWYQNRRRYPSAFLWFVNYALQLSGIVLESFGTRLSPLLTVVTAHTMIIGGNIMLLAGLEMFAGKKVRRMQNLALISVFIPIHLYFSILSPDINALSINISFAVAFISAQGVWLVFYRVKKAREVYIPCGLIFAAYFLLHLSNIAAKLPFREINGLEIFTKVDFFVLIASMFLSMILSYTLVLLVNRSLRSELENELEAHRKVEHELRLSEEKFSKAFLTSPYAIIVVNLESGALIEANDAFLEISGYDRNEILGRSTTSLNFWEKQSERDKVAADLLAGVPVKGRVLRFRKKDGSLFTGLFSSQRISIAAENCILSSLADISANIQTEEELRSHRRFLYDIIELSGTLICVKDLDGRYDLVNRAWEKVTQISRGEALGRTDAELFDPEESASFRKSDLEVIATGKSVEIEEQLTVKGLDHHFISVKFPLRDKSDSVSGVCAMITEITERKIAEEKIRYLASHDALTDLPGLRLAKERLHLALSLARRNNSVIAVMFVDLDDFKNVNDRLGHDAGDFVLTQVARRLLECVRQSDTVARIGGDEFLVILNSLSALEDAGAIAQKLIDSIQKPFDYRGKQARIGLSIGIAQVQNDDQDLSDVLVKADKAMYRIKKEGKNGYCFAQDDEQH